MKSKRAILLSHPLSLFVSLKNSKMGALGAAAGAEGGLGTAGAFPLVSVGASLMVMELAQRLVTLILMMINSCSYNTNDLVLI